MSERPGSSLPAGAYDQPITVALAARLGALDEALTCIEDLDPGGAPAALARLVHDRLLNALRGITGKDDARLEQQLALANALVDLLVARGPKKTTLAEDQVEAPGRALKAVLRAASGLARPAPPLRPEIPLHTSDLLTNARHDLSLASELRRELASADRVDLLCSFLKWSGFRLLQDELKEFLTRCPGQLRVITTAYMSATEPRALDELAGIGAQVKVSYDVGRTRLHAKAWLFHRDSGFSTACIGSSNLSASAMLDGLEWNVRLSKVDNGPILERFQATFEQYWDEPEFESYDPARDGARYLDAIRRQTGDRHRLITAFEVTARTHQREILEALEAERASGHMRNLVVAATGTGKTILAALDYKRLRAGWKDDDSLLFIAHRRELLDQSHTTFQVVLRDPVFGEKLYAGDRPRSNRHVFASVQSLTPDVLATLDPRAYRMVIVDEFHHAKAESYDRVLRHLRPEVLLGLTATPERADGQSVLGWFNDRIAAELRLWKALDQGLLSPFQYFGVRGPDLSGVTWTRGKYDKGELSAALRADPLFGKSILQQVHRHIADPQQMRALGFCADLAHAEVMTALFNEAGLAAAMVSGDMPDRERDAALAALRDGKLRVLFSVDLLSEGIDLPDVDTVLFLRPTESATVFLQQLGRGLRRSEGKSCLTVLDFIGGAHRSFRFDARFRALLGGTRRAIVNQVERGFPNVPPGCAIHLDREPQQAVLENIKRALAKRGAGLVEDLREVADRRGRDVDLRTFLNDAQLELEDVYSRAGRSWTGLRRSARLEMSEQGQEELKLERSLARMLHLDDEARLAALRAMVERAAPPAADASDPAQRMLFVLLGHVRRPYDELPAALASLWRHGALREELRQLLGLLDDRRRTPGHALDGRLRSLPLRVHASYSLDEVMAAVDERTTKGGVQRIQAGVYHVKPRALDLLFVTLEKSPGDYSPTTLYNDYPLSQTRFHWETQSSCHEGTKTGRRYLQAMPGAPGGVLLFVRQRREDARGCTMPYLHLGQVHHAAHRGSRPMQIEWDLEHPMPASFFQEVKVAAG